LEIESDLFMYKCLHIVPLIWYGYVLWLQTGWLCGTWHRFFCINKIKVSRMINVLQIFFCRHVLLRHPWRVCEDCSVMYTVVQVFMSSIPGYLTVLQSSLTLWLLSFAILHKSSTARPRHSSCTLRGGETPASLATKSLRHCDVCRTNEGKTQP